MEIRALVHKGPTKIRRIHREVKKSKLQVFRVRNGLVGPRRTWSDSEPSKLMFQSMKRSAFCGMVQSLQANYSDPPGRTEEIV